MSNLPASGPSLTGNFGAAAKRIRLIFGIGLVGLLSILALQPELREQLGAAVSALSLLDIALVTLLFVLMRIIQATVVLRLLALHDISIAFSSCMNLAGLKGLFNLAFFGLGLAAQSAQAKIDLFVPIRTMLLVNVTQSFMLVLALGASLFAATVFFFSSTNLPAPAAFVLGGLAFAAVGLVGSAACLFRRCLPRRIREFRIGGRLLLAESVGEPGGALAFGLVLLEVGLVALRVARVLAIAYAIDPSVDLHALTITVLAADTVGVVPITPGGIGIRELLIGLIGAAAEHYELFLAAAIIDRVLTIAFNLGHGTAAVWRSGRVCKTAQ